MFPACLTQDITPTNYAGTGGFHGAFFDRFGGFGHKIPGRPG